MRRIVILCVVLSMFLLALSAAPQPNIIKHIKIKFVKGLLTVPLGGDVALDPHGHSATKISVKRKEKVSWEGIHNSTEDIDILSFEVCVYPVTPGAPGSPFESEATCWKTNDGIILVGPPIKGAIGHGYKYVIKAHGQETDPHIDIGR